MGVKCNKSILLYLVSDPAIRFVRITRQGFGLLLIPFFLAFLILVADSDSHAADVCVGPTATGNGSGADWGNIAQWDSLTFVRGNTYYLRDGTYGSKALNTPASGSYYIYIKKATESAHGPSAGWSPSYGGGIAAFNNASLSIATNYWDVSGVTGGGPGNWKSGHGIVFTSPAGTSIEYISLSSGVSNIFVRHIYFNQTGNTEVFTSRANGIYAPGDMNNSLFEYNYFENLGGLPFALRNGSGNIFQYNYTGNICGMSVADLNQHCEMLVEHGMNDVHFRWNYVAESPSSGGFVKNNTHTSDYIRIYGNVFSNGFAIQCNTGTCTNWRVFNNTFHHMTSGPMGGDGSITGYYYNNIAYNSNVHGLVIDHKYNWFSKISKCSCTMNGNSTENILTRMPANCDVISTISDPFVNSSGTMPEDWRLKGEIYGWSGYNVCNLDACTGENKYNIDAFGNMRGLYGVWDRGAYEYTGSGKIPSPPLAIGIQ